jgi:hypothetical protein
MLLSRTSKPAGRRAGRWAAAALAALVFPAAQAAATGYYPPPPDPGPAIPDTSACGIVVESDFGAYTVEKCVEVWAPDNAGNPYPVPGNFTYVYTLESDVSSITNIVQFDLETPVHPLAIAGATFQAGTGDVDPANPSGPAVESIPGDGASTSGVVRVFFLGIPGAGDFCEPVATQGLCPGAKSAEIVVHSPFGPGGVNDNMIALFDDFSLDEISTCIGPNTLPNPTPCPALFWKLKALFSFFLKHHFPDAKWDDLTNFAAETSTVFNTGQEVVVALFHGWFWFASDMQRAKLQLSALLLNISAGELFPANTKCRLFFDTPVDTNGDDIGDTTVGEQLVIVESNILSGDPALVKEAIKIARDLNEGIGVIDTTLF